MTTTQRTLARLTRRERQVADLVAEGHTNRQIGRELFLSVKTVERHLARIFNKLDITARSKLAAIVASDRHYDLGGAVSGQQVTPGGSVELMRLAGLARGC